MGAPLCLTFGVELEFIVSYNPAGYEEKMRNAREIFQELNTTPTLHEKYGILVRLDMIQLLNENGFDTNDYEGTESTKWTVDTDGTVTPAVDRDNWCAIEVKTPVFFYSDADASREIEMVVELLVSNFGLYTNDNCGLHVHVGNESSGFELRTLQNFCSLITAFDRQLDSLHPYDRLQTPYAKSTRTAFIPSATLTDNLSIIDRLISVEDLVDQFHEHDKYMAFNFYNLREDVEKPLRTIEFRQHQGTLDPDLIINWVKVACGLVHRSYTNPGGFRDLIDTHMHDSKSYTVIDLFTDLQLRDLAEFYAPRVYAQYGTDQYPPGEDESMEYEVEEVEYSAYSTPGWYGDQYPPGEDDPLEYEEPEFIGYSPPDWQNTPW